MNPRFEDLLNALPEKPPRSRLEPFRELIGELLRRKRTYREIASILLEKFQLQAAPNTIHDFVRTRSLAKRKPVMRAPSGKRETVLVDPVPRLATSNTALNAAEVKQRIAMLKARKAAVKPTREQFQFDPSQPLRLKKPGRKISDQSTGS